MINFNAGPAALPKEVTQQASEAIINYNNTGLSILEIAHRGKHFDAILEESKQLVKELCALTDDYDVLWLQGGGRLQFAMIPMNFLPENGAAGYIDSGHWSTEAMEYARYYGKVQMLVSSKENNYTHLPQWPDVVDENLSYVHFTTNNTIYGSQWPEIPKCRVPLMADMSSDIFSMHRDYTNCALFYAVAQKNIGAAGNTLVVVRKDMLERIVRTIPPALSFKEQAAKGSVLNTPPVFSIYVSLLTLRWIKAKSIAAIEKENNEKAALLYSELDRNPLFHAPVAKESRSKMNVVFHGNDKEAEQQFLALCKQNDIVGIEGHRSVGAFRASLYNAISLADVAKLVSLMQDFEKHYKEN
jgi:phosphoserine aminotransferase